MLRVTVVNASLMAQRLKAIAGFGETPAELFSRFLDEAGKTMTAYQFAEMMIRVIRQLDAHSAVKIVLLTMTDDFVDAMLNGEDARSQAKLEVADRLF